MIAPPLSAAPDELAALCERQRIQIAELEATNTWLMQQLGLGAHRQFGPSREKSPEGQAALLFNEAEVTQDPAAPEPDVTVTCKRKSRGPREPALSDPEVEEIEYRLPEEEQVCPECQGRLHEMGEEVREEIRIVPAQYRLVRHKRMKYVCRHCSREETHTPIRIASMPEPAFWGSLASPSAVASIMTGKFVEGSPLYRQEQSFRRQGLLLSRQNMANWMIRGADWLEHLYRRMRSHLLSGDILHADETTLQVLKEPGRKPQTDSYLWLYRSGRDGPPIVCFEYQPTRAAEHPARFLAGYSGYLHADGYGAYDTLGGVKLVGCWAHARRKFYEAFLTLPADARKRGGTRAHVGLAYCDALFRIERDLRDASPEVRLEARLARSRPVLDACAAWLQEQSGQVLPKSPLGIALTYCRNQWPKLTAFLSDGRLEIDNNRAERSIKPFVIGRKNWLFADSQRGARASAVIYSIVETAKENGLDPLRYLTLLFERLPNTNCKDDLALDALLPWSAGVQEPCACGSRQPSAAPASDDAAPPL